MWPWRVVAEPEIEGIRIKIRTRSVAAGLNTK
jgi:hypothetical protein